jgi:hypothetical protein
LDFSFDRKDLRNGIRRSLSIQGSDLDANPDFFRQRKAADAFTAIRHQNHWFRIDNTDINAKRNFVLLTISLSLTGTDRNIVPQV